MSHQKKRDVQKTPQVKKSQNWQLKSIDQIYQDK